MCSCEISTQALALKLVLVLSDVDGLQDAGVATELLDQNKDLRSLLQQDPADATPEVNRPATQPADIFYKVSV